MGILNVTPDSFYDGGKYTSDIEICHQVELMLNEGADIIDIGGYSSRPRGENITEDDEILRVNGALSTLNKQFSSTLFSVDTFRSKVAESSLNNGAFLINDISGGNLDNKMLETIGHFNCPYVIMHMKGNPQTMSQQTQYDDLITEVYKDLVSKITRANSYGISNLIVDPGFGFSKTLDQNYELLRNLDKFASLNATLLIGISRKSMIYKKLNTSAEEALNGTTALNLFALTKGAKIIRVHDVKEAKETITLFNELT